MCNACIICGSGKIAVRKFTELKKTYDLVCCATCQVRYHWPIPNNTVLSEYYASFIPAETKDAEKAIQTNHTINVRDKKFDYNYNMTASVRRENPAGRILEVGCFTGLFLTYFDQKKYSCVGLDLNNTLLSYGKKHYKLDLRYGTIFDFKFRDSEFGLIIFHQLLEHLNNPIEFFTEVKRILKPSGYITLSVPHVLTHFKIVYPAHVFHFSISAINILLDRFSFSKEKIECRTGMSIMATGKLIK